MKRKKIVLAAGSAAVIALAVGAVCFYQSSQTKPTESTYKETTVVRGNLTKGVSESGSVTIGTLTQEIDFEDSSSSSSGSSASSGSGAMSAVMGGAASMGASSGTGSSSQSSSDEALVVEEVYIAVGQR